MDRAQHLSTKCTPTIYYKPYILTTGQKALVEEQISQAQAQIDANEEGTTLRPHPESDLRTRDDGATVEEEKAGEGEDTNAGGVQEEGQRSPSPPAGNALKDDEALVLED